MKKIISLLSVFAMIATMFTTVAFADDNNKFYIEETVDGANVTLTLYMTTNQTITAASGTHDLTAAYAACDSIDYKQSDATVYSINATQKVLSWSIADVNGVTGTVELGTVTFTNVKSDFSLPQKRNFTAKDDAKANVIASFTNEAAGYAVKAPVAAPVVIDAVTAGNDMYGMKTALTKIAFDSIENPVVRLYKDGEESEKSKEGYALPSNVKGGAAEIIGIIRYAADVTGTFVLKVFDGANEVVSATYVAE